MSLVQEAFGTESWPELPYKWIGTQEYPGGSIELYDLLADFDGHPKGSTVSEETLRLMGIWQGKGLEPQKGQTK